MKKITAQSIDAFMNARPFKKDNMTIEVLPNVTVMKLYGNAIAYRFNDPERTLTISNAGWDTKTTKERLNAIPGVHITQKNWQWYLNGQPWDGKLVDVDYKSNAI
jgi:hypothetical protein